MTMHNGRLTNIDNISVSYFDDDTTLTIWVDHHTHKQQRDLYFSLSPDKAVKFAEELLDQAKQLQEKHG